MLKKTENIDWFLFLDSFINTDNVIIHVQRPGMALLARLPIFFCLADIFFFSKMEPKRLAQRWALYTIDIQKENLLTIILINMSMP